MTGPECCGNAEVPAGPLRRALRSITAKRAAWRTARALDTLRSEVNARWPNRSKVSDGTLGDAAHASRKSDHNPWLIVNGIGVVRAFDCTANGIDATAYAEYMRMLGKSRDSRLVPGGYVIWNKRIASERDNWAWRAYHGSNEHRHHVHLSLSTNPAGFDSTRPWGIGRIGAPAGVWRQFAKGATDAALAAKGGMPAQVSELQRLLAKLGFYRASIDGAYGPISVSAVIAFKDAAGWHNRTSLVDLELIKTLRTIAAAKKP